MAFLNGIPVRVEPVAAFGSEIESETIEGTKAAAVEGSVA